MNAFPVLKCSSSAMNANNTNGESIKEGADNPINYVIKYPPDIDYDEQRCIYERSVATVKHEYQITKGQDLPSQCINEEAGTISPQSGIENDSECIEIVRNNLKQDEIVFGFQYSRQNQHKTPLHFAVTYGVLPLIKRIMEKGGKRDLAIQDFQLCTPVHIACESGKPEIIRSLLNASADDLREPLKLKNKEGLSCLLYFVNKHNPSTHDQFAIVDLLLEKGADPNQGCGKAGKTIVHFVADKKNSALYKHLQTHHNEQINFQQARFDKSYISYDCKKDVFRFVKDESDDDE